MSSASPCATGLQANDRNATIGDECAALVSRFDTGLTALAGRERNLALGAEFRHIEPKHDLIRLGNRIYRFT